MIMEEAGLGFRATRDLDIVLQVDLLDPAFFSSFWEFVRMGEYRIQQAESGKPKFYRFAAPDQPGYPSMLELFSVRPNLLTPRGGGHLTPIPAGGMASSLSAILLDDTYYSFLKNGIRSIDALPIVGQEHLLPLKVRAWLEMTGRKEAGEPIDSRAIRKHRNDVFRLSTVVDPTFAEAVPALVREDMRRFLAAMHSEALDLRSLGISADRGTVLGQLRGMYVRD
ncbi:MAG: hypothetical protein JW820_06470 [Spirochaetales bacterium]|nr:hypothetical protein [Spirochaetales bacterium]